MTLRSCVLLFLQPHGGEASDVHGLSLSLSVWVLLLSFSFIPCLSAFKHAVLFADGACKCASVFFALSPGWKKKKNGRKDGV